MRRELMRHLAVGEGRGGAEGVRTEWTSRYLLLAKVRSGFQCRCVCSFCGTYIHHALLTKLCLSFTSPFEEWKLNTNNILFCSNTLTIFGPYYEDSFTTSTPKSRSLFFSSSELPIVRSLSYCYPISLQ